MCELKPEYILHFAVNSQNSCAKDVKISKGWNEILLFFDEGGSTVDLQDMINATLMVDLLRLYMLLSVKEQTSGFALGTACFHSQGYATYKCSPS